MNELTKIGKFHGTDKAGPEHNYTETVYYRMLERIKDRDIKLLEIGAGNTGASIKMWKDFLPNAEITLFDPFFITSPVVTVTQKEIEEIGVKVVVGNQLSRRDLQKVPGGEEYYDIIIDDASHVSDGISLSLSVLLPMLKKNGCYIVEDLGCAKSRDQRLSDCNNWLDGDTVNQNIEKIYHREEYHMWEVLSEFKRTRNWKSKILNDIEVDFLERNVKTFTFFKDFNGSDNLVIIKKV